MGAGRRRSRRGAERREREYGEAHAVPSPGSAHPSVWSARSYPRECAAGPARARCPHVPTPRARPRRSRQLRWPDGRPHPGAGQAHAALRRRPPARRLPPLQPREQRHRGGLAVGAVPPGRPWGSRSPTDARGTWTATAADCACSCPSGAPAAPTRRASRAATPTSSTGSATRSSRTDPSSWWCAAPTTSYRLDLGDVLGTHREAGAGAPS